MFYCPFITFGAPSTPSFEEESYILLFALSLNIDRPLWFHETGL